MAEQGLQKAFENFAKDGKLSPASMKKWFKEAAVIDKETGIIEADVDDVIAKTSTDKKNLDFSGLKECINTLAKEKKLEPTELMVQLSTAGAKIAKAAKGK